MRWWAVLTKKGSTAEEMRSLADACAGLDRARTVRPITAADRMLAHGRAIGLSRSPRRRTHFRFGVLDVVVVEAPGEPTAVYLGNEKDGTVVQATTDELSKAAAAVQQILANPPPARRKPR
jgi:hypothetical protein